MRKSFLTILGLLITVMVVVFLSYLLIKAYLFRSLAVSSGQAGPPQNVQGLDQYRTVIDDARSLTSDVNKRIRQQQEDIDKMLH